ncbi:MAG: hypothetical protein AB8G11_01660 [Saprospiraceae bacterium]
MKNYIYISFVTLILVSCANQESITVEGSMEKPFFDVKGFFESEIAESKLKAIEKTVRINGESETQTLTAFDLNKELSMFINSDINKPSLFDKYNTFETEYSTTYKTTDEDLAVQRIKLFKDENGNFIKILINRKADTQIYTSDKALTYEPNIGFSIKNAQKVLLSDEKDYEIMVKF